MPFNLMGAFNRREFLLLRPGGDGGSLELSCERLYMKFVDAQADEAMPDLFGRLESELREVDRVRLVDRAWLARDDLRREVDRVLSAFRARGGRVMR